MVLMKKSTIWENTDGCSDQYRCATVLYLLSILSHVYKIVLASSVGAPGHDRGFVYGLNTTDKMFLYNVNDKCATSLCGH